MDRHRDKNLDDARTKNRFALDASGPAVTRPQEPMDRH
jgi:hypothetical protein